MRRKSRGGGRSLFVRERRAHHEEKLQVAKLPETLVHEEFHVPVHIVYDFSHGKNAKEVGGFGEVQVVSHRKTGTKYAMKIVKLSSVKSQKAFEFVVNEVDLLKSLDHPNIVRLQEVYMSDSHLYMAMDLITGGNLAGDFRCTGEPQAAVIVRQVVRALRYLHDRHIAHRDLKLENILIETGGKEGSALSIKLVDFGLSAIYQENDVSCDVLGSWNYVAPEVIQGNYRPAPADMWSLGVVAYVLMSRTLPFDADSTEGIQRNILAGRFGFKGRAWAGASEASKHFVRSLLLKSPDLRRTAAAAQKHDWLRGAEDLSQTPRKDSRFREEVTQSLLNFREANPMKQLALEVVARTLDPAQISLLAEEFDRADSNNNGKVSLVEFKRWLEANGTARRMTEEDVEALFNSVDFDLSGFIHFNEFLAATILQRDMNEDFLRPAFDRLDHSHTGFINIHDVTLITGVAANEEEARVLVGHFDTNGDEQISFEEFVNGMRRMGGSAPQGGGLLSDAPAVENLASFPDSLWKGVMNNIRGEGKGTGGAGESSNVLAVEAALRLEPHQLESLRTRGAGGGENLHEHENNAVELDGHDLAISRVDEDVSAATAAASEAVAVPKETSRDLPLGKCQADNDEGFCAATAAVQAAEDSRDNGAVALGEEVIETVTNGRAVGEDTPIVSFTPLADGSLQASKEGKHSAAPARIEGGTGPGRPRRGCACVVA